ncbi:MAG: hypothetical protein IJA69_04945 [Clostridia bacterium]|nr:hypothetical protein [Clostridia bacterium]
MAEKSIAELDKLLNRNQPEKKTQKPQQNQSAKQDLDVNKFISNIPVENGKKMSKEDYTLMNEILRLAFFSMAEKQFYYTDTKEPNKKVHVSKQATGRIRFLKSPYAQRVCRNVVNKLETTISDYNKDIWKIKNLFTFGKFVLQEGKEYSMEHLAKEGKILNWEALTTLMLEDGFVLEQSNLLEDFFAKAKEADIKYQKAAPTSAEQEEPCQEA